MKEDLIKVRGIVFRSMFTLLLIFSVIFLITLFTLKIAIDVHIYNNVELKFYVFQWLYCWLIYIVLLIIFYIKPVMRELWSILVAMYYFCIKGE